jgi:hypothetical protein
MLNKNLLKVKLGILIKYLADGTFILIPSVTIERINESSRYTSGRLEDFFKMLFDEASESNEPDLLDRLKQVLIKAEINIDSPGKEMSDHDNDAAAFDVLRFFCQERYITTDQLVERAEEISKWLGIGLKEVLAEIAEVKSEVDVCLV